MREYEYIGDPLHAAGEVVPVVERAPTDLFSGSTGHAFISAGGVSASGGAHAALAVGGKALATVASTASLASGIVFGNQILGTSKPDPAAASTVSVGATTLGDDSTGPMPDGTTLGIETSNPFLSPNPSATFVAANAFGPGVIPAALTSSTNQGFVSQNPESGSAAAPSNNQDPARIYTVTASPTPSAANALADAGWASGAALALPDLPPLDFGHTSSATPSGGAVDTANANGNYAISVGSGGGGGANHMSSATPTAGTVAAAKSVPGSNGPAPKSGIASGSGDGKRDDASSENEVKESHPQEPQHKQESERKEHKGSRD